jgi:type II secretion system protein G
MPRQTFLIGLAAMLLVGLSFVASRADSDSTGSAPPASQPATTDPATSDDPHVVSAKLQVYDIRTAIEEFNLDNGRYPTTTEGIKELVYDTSHLKTWHQYLPRVPIDPWGNEYVYRCPGTGDRSFDLYSCGPDGLDQNGGGDNIQ